MTEAHSNPDLVAFHRQSELEASQRAYQEQENALPQQTSQAQALVIPAEATTAESQALPSPPAPATNPLSALRFSLVVVLILGLLLIALRQQRKR